jgi:hypothetical protein
MWLHKVLPERHLDDASKDTVKLGAGLLATLAALVLGLLVSSAKTSFDAMNSGIAQAGAKVLLADHMLADYGPETKDVREQLRQIVASSIDRIWPEEKGRAGGLRAVESIDDAGKLYRDKLHELTPTNDFQKSRLAQALQISDDVLQILAYVFFWAIQIILFILILVYCTARELVRVIGKEKMRRSFFGPTPLQAF